MTDTNTLAYRAGASDGVVAVADYKLVPAHQPGTGLERKRSAIWRNGNRNQALSNIARALAGKLAPETLVFGLPIDTMPLAPLVEHAGWVAVVVESPEHARELAILLPDFAVVTAEDGKPSVPWGVHSPFRTIFTLCAVHDHPGFAADVVINGVGGRYPLDIPPMLGGNGRLLIELGDDFDKQAGKETTRRLQNYLLNGWRLFNARGYLPWATAGMMLDTTRPKKLPSFLEGIHRNTVDAVAASTGK